MTLARLFRGQTPSAEAPPSTRPSFEDGEAHRADIPALPGDAPTPAPTRGPIAKPTCKDKARILVHKYAAFGTAWSLLPIPMATSAGLTALETHMIYWIARVYGEEPSRSDVLMTAAGLELCSVALKTVAIEGALLVPGIGWGIKATIAAGAIEAIGNAIIQHYEQKYPGKAA